ncbi:MAG: aspartyl/glutamyl-tRNA amidotransferase subunit C [Treponema sp.]|jgi:aspartyl-tRNA(Asn)/glutamyl-tRNA(Gln) amidotransferase subunit C|nr:aspartyl/glutamyl-tRNA amidotransferase subunit C [Treponema sp.]
MTIEDLKETAALAHLNMSDAELAAAFPAFEQMLRFFAIMQAADGDEALAGEDHDTAAGIAAAGDYRPDAAESGGFPGDLNETMLNNAGERDGRFVVIPNVL